jgi:ABC-type uncharacterized transport system auxiliary subunit
MKHRNVFFLALMVCLEALNGCGAARPSKFYQLTVPGEKAVAPDPAPYSVALLLGPITAPDLYRDDRLVYTSENQAMGTYEYRRWAEPPTEMINDILLRELQRSGHYAHIYSLRSGVRGDYVLRGRLYDFREIDGKGLSVRVAFDFELHDNKKGTSVWSHAYSHDQPVDGRDIPAVVAALDRDVQSGLSEVLAGLDQYFSSHMTSESAAGSSRQQ